MCNSKEFKILHLENRIDKLSSNPVENYRLIKKAERRLRNLKNS